MIDEWGRSSESVESFVERNMHPASPAFPKGLANGKEVLLSNNIPFLKIQGFEGIDWDVMYNEAKYFEKHYIPHRTHEPHAGWESLCLHGISSVHTEAPHVYGYPSSEDAPFKWTDVSEFCPQIKKFLNEQFDYKKFYRVRIMKLRPGGFIIPHKDSISESENHLGPINIALNNPKGCQFYMDGHGVLPFDQGTIMSLNLFNVHCVYNNSSEDRYHLIVHGKKGPSWSKRFYKSYLQFNGDLNDD